MLILCNSKNQSSACHNVLLSMSLYVHSHDLFSSRPGTLLRVFHWTLEIRMPWYSPWPVQSRIRKPLVVAWHLSTDTLDMYRVNLRRLADPQLPKALKVGRSLVIWRFLDLKHLKLEIMLHQLCILYITYVHHMYIIVHIESANPAQLDPRLHSSYPIQGMQSRMLPELQTR